MTIILRLEGLDAKAGIEDIRAFFGSVRIPDGGVCIVGGRLQEAFIAFNTEREAQLAMRQTGNVLKGSKVTLHISKMEELEHRLETVLKEKKKASQHAVRLRPRAAVNRMCSNTRPRDNTAGLSPSSTYPVSPASSNLSVNAQNVHPSTADIQTSDAQSLDPSARTPEQTLNSQPGYVRLFGLPPSTTKDDICHFFKGLTVQEAIVNVRLGLNHGCLVKFATMQDACAALKFNQQSLGPFCVDVRGACEKIWNSALQECEDAVDVEEIRHQYPLKESVNHRQKSASVLRPKRKSVNRLLTNGPKKLKVDSESGTPAVEYIVMVSNLPKTMTKTEIKELFGCATIPHKNVQHLLDKEGNRTDTAFLIFNRTEDFDYAMNLTGCHVCSNTITVSSITKEAMREKMSKIKSGLVVPPEGSLGADMGLEAKTCLFIRNMPADVDKDQIKSLFSNYKIKKDNIVLLRDSEGSGIGEAVIQFKTKKLAALAQRLHGKDFLGTKVLLTCITMKQMEDILAK
uniref:RNA binding motif protein 12Ba n=1 Tax=Oreochromis niloticus TaxID=8128 RepID=I3JFI3_ORENI